MHGVRPARLVESRARYQGALSSIVPLHPSPSRRRLANNPPPLIENIQHTHKRQMLPQLPQLPGADAGGQAPQGQGQGPQPGGRAVGAGRLFRGARLRKVGPRGEGPPAAPGLPAGTCITPLSRSLSVRVRVRDHVACQAMPCAQSVAVDNKERGSRPDSDWLTDPLLQIPLPPINSYRRRAKSTGSGLCASCTCCCLYL